MNKFLSHVWSIPIFTAFAYGFVYLYKSTFLRHFDISSEMTNVLLNDFILIGTFFFINAFMIMLVYAVDIVQKKENKLAEFIKHGNLWIAIIVWPLILTFILLLISFCSDKAITFEGVLVPFLIMSSAALLLRIFAKDNFNREMFLELMIFALVAMLLAWSYGVNQAQSKSKFLSFSKQNQTYLMIEKISDSEGIFKILNLKTNKLSNEFYIFNLSDKKMSLRDISIEDAQ